MQRNTDFSEAHIRVQSYELLVSSSCDFKMRENNLSAPTLALICLQRGKCLTLKPRLHEQWHFQFLSCPTDFAKLSVQFCQVL